MSSRVRVRPLRRILFCLALGGAGAAGVASLSVGARAATVVEPIKMAAAQAHKRLVQLELQRAPSDAIFPFMKHPDASVRARAAVALGRLQDWRMGEPMVEFLSDPDPGVRKAAAFSLSLLDPVLPMLVDQIKAGRKGDDPLVRGPAMTRAAVEKKLDARLHLEERADVRKALYTALGPMAIGAGLHHLQLGLVGKADEAAWAARALGVHGHRRRTDAVQSKEILDALGKLLASDSDDTRFGATYALFRLRSKDVPNLTERLRADSDPRIRLYAARALGGQAGAEDVLVGALKDPDWRVRVEAIRALGQAPRPRGVFGTKDMDAVAAAAKDALTRFMAEGGLADAPMAHVVLAATDVLARAAPPLAAPHLEALASLMGQGKRPSSEAWQVRCAIAQAHDTVSGTPQRVLKCGEPNEPAYRAQLRAVHVIAAAPGGEGEKQRRLAAYLRHADAHVRVAAAEQLGALDVVRAPDVPALLAEQLEAEKDAGAAGTMAAGLKAHPSPSHVKALRKALARFGGQSGDGASAAVTIIQALAAANATDAAGDIKLLLTSPAVRVRMEAQAALVALGQKVPPLPLRDPPLWPDDDLPSRVTLKTNKGDIVLRLYREDAPLTVTNFVSLARKGFYKNLSFHRVVGDFVVQGGDPRGDGFGGPGYTIPCEYNPRPYERGVVGMALDGRDSGGSQFFITHSPQPHLDAQYTAFAEVESGMDVVDALLPDDLILHVQVPN